MKKGVEVKYRWRQDIEALSGSSVKALILMMLDYGEMGKEPENVPKRMEGAYSKIFGELRKMRSCSEGGKKGGGNPRLKKRDKKQDIKPEANTQYEDLFEEFWKAYPKKVGKTYAKMCFVKCKPTQELLRAMLSAIEKQKKSEQWKSNKGKFIPNPSTWLNQGRWMDEDCVMEKERKYNFKIGVYL